MQEDVALYATEVIRLKAQVMCLHYQPQTILAYAAAEQMSDADKALIPQALQLIRDKPLRNFRIDIAADSLVQIDEAQEKQDRMQFLQAFGGFLQQALPVGQASPELIPVMMDLLKYGVQAFKAARPLEGSIDAAVEQLKMAAQQPRENPEAQRAQMVAQAEQAKAQMMMQVEQAKLQQASQVEAMKAQNDQQLESLKQQFEAQLAQQKIAAEQQMAKYKADLDAATKIMVARISANPGLDIPALEQQQAVTERVMQDMGGEVRQAMQNLVALYGQMASSNDENMKGVRSALSTLTAPKRIIRGPDGRAVGVEAVQQTLELEPRLQ